MYIYVCVCIYIYTPERADQMRMDGKLKRQAWEHLGGYHQPPEVNYLSSYTSILGDI